MVYPLREDLACGREVVKASVLREKPMLQIELLVPVEEIRQKTLNRSVFPHL